MCQSISFQSKTLSPDFLQTLQTIGLRQINRRIHPAGKSAGPVLTVSFESDPTLPGDSYRITTRSSRILAEASTRCGFLAALGFLLRDGTFSSTGFQPGNFCGEIHPQKHFRCMYFASHFHNFYHDAPIEKVREYIEDLSLWGLNTLCFWFDLHHYSSCLDPEGIAMIERIKQMISHAKALGLKTMLLTLSNEMFANSPREIRADWFPQGNYHSQLMGHYHIEACPSKPGGMEAILSVRSQMLDAFADTPPDYITIWPYDQGGCTCPDCAPWGGNGFLRVARALKELIHQKMPQTEICLSAWYFDHFTTGEWDAFIREVERGDYSEWVKYLVVFFNESEPLPSALQENGNLAGIPLIGFPEISMFQAEPWGGFGANPMPTRLEALWRRDSALLSGGYPYSEGIFEDINKAIMLSFYTGTAKTAYEAVTEYARFEYSAEHAEEISDLIFLMERTLPRVRDEERETAEGLPAIFRLEQTEQVEEIYKRAQKLNALLDQSVRSSWRWRILYLRALIDHELLAHNFTISGQCEEYFEELTEIYFAEQANYYVAPPTRRSLKKTREFHLV